MLGGIPGANLRLAEGAGLKAIAKLPVLPTCHSERSEESGIFNKLRSFTAFRMTKIGSAKTS
jgi:hypothetical protein